MLRRHRRLMEARSVVMYGWISATITSHARLQRIQLSYQPQIRNHPRLHHYHRYGLSLELFTLAFMFAPSLIFAAFGAAPPPTSQSLWSISRLYPRWLQPGFGNAGELAGEAWVYGALCDCSLVL